MPIRPLALALLCAAPSASSQVLSPIELFAFRSPSLDESGLGAQNSMSVVGDVNGDGIADLAAGASGEDDNAGRVYVLNGATGDVLNAFLSPRNVEAEGFGRATAGPGDLDGDGTPDLIIGATGGDPGGISGAGRVYAVNIATKAILWTAVSPNPTEDGRFGYVLATVPDVNDDGVAEIAVGAPDEGVVEASGELQGDAGRAYLLSGKTGEVLLALVPEKPDDSFPSAFGGLRGSDFGYAVTGLADAQGHGVMAVGAPGEWTGDFDNDPAKYDGRLYIAEPFASSIRRTRSTNAWDRGNFANSLSGTPDLDGDGFEDLVVGAPDESLTNDGDNEGQGYLVSGASGLPLRRFSSPQKYGDSNFGWQVSTVPTLNRTGHPGLLFTETTLCCEKIDALYVFDGVTGELAASLEVPNTRFDIAEAIGLPDLDGDGRSEVMVGFTVGTFDEIHYVAVVPVSSPQAELEPNDAIDTPQEIGGASPIVIRSVVGGGDLGFDGSRLLVQEGEAAEDLFLVETTAPGLTVTLSDFGSGEEEEDLDLYVLDPQTLSFHGTSATLSATESVSLPSLPAGRHLIAVDFYGAFGDASNSFDYAFYTLTVEGSFTALVDTDDDAPSELALEPPFPNPSRGHATLAYTLPQPGPVRLTVFDALGREVARLVDSHQPDGRHIHQLDGLELAPGAYRVRLEAAGQAQVQSITVLR